MVWIIGQDVAVVMLSLKIGIKVKGNINLLPEKSWAYELICHDVYIILTKQSYGKIFSPL